MSSAIGRLPEVMYLVETPRLSSGWAMSSFNLAFKTAIFASLFFFLAFDGLLSSADSLGRPVSIIIFIAAGLSFTSKYQNQALSPSLPPFPSASSVHDAASLFCVAENRFVERARDGS